MLKVVQTVEQRVQIGGSERSRLLLEGDFVGVFDTLEGLLKRIEAAIELAREV